MKRATWILFWVAWDAGFFVYDMIMVGRSAAAGDPLSVMFYLTMALLMLYFLRASLGWWADRKKTGRE